MKYIYNILYSLLVIAGLTSCMTDDLTDNCIDSKGGSVAKARVMLSMSVPNSQLPSATRDVSDESGIESLNLLVFENDVLKETINITSDYQTATVTEDIKTLYVAIEETEQPVLLAIVANAPVSGLTPGTTTLLQAKEQLVFTNSHTANSIPMYGEAAEFTSGLNRDNLYDVDVELVRSFASIEVQYPATATENFEFMKVRVVNANTDGYVADGLDPIERTTTPDTWATAMEPNTTVSANGLKTDIFYIGETSNVDPKVSIIIEGNYNGVVGYYRLDMINSENVEIGSLDRNYKYMISLQDISFEGRSATDVLTGGADNAAMGGAITIIIADEYDILDITTNGQYFLGVNSTRLVLIDSENGEGYARLKILTDNNPEGWNITNVVGDIEFLAIDDFASLGPNPTGGTIREIYSLWIYSATNTGGTFSIESGNIVKEITVVPFVATPP